MRRKSFFCDSFASASSYTVPFVAAAATRATFLGAILSTRPASSCSPTYVPAARASVSSLGFGPGFFGDVPGPCTATCSVRLLPENFLTPSGSRSLARSAIVSAFSVLLPLSLPSLSSSPSSVVASLWICFLSFAFVASCSHCRSTSVELRLRRFPSADVGFGGFGFGFGGGGGASAAGGALAAASAALSAFLLIRRADLEMFWMLFSPPGLSHFSHACLAVIEPFELNSCGGGWSVVSMQ